MCLKSEMYKFCIVLIVAVTCRCEPISNASFNSQIRANYVPDDNYNATNVKTLQKHGVVGRSGINPPEQNSIKFKEVPDSLLSSSHSRGLLHHEHTGYGLSDYDEPHYGLAYQEYQPHDLGHPYINHHDPGLHHIPSHDPGLHHVPNHHVGYGHGHGHHHKHYDHSLATKALLWPIAGIALLGAAAALVSNPVLLQLGVVSGKRKRRQTEDIEFAKNSIKKWSNQDDDNDKREKTLKRRVFNRRNPKTSDKINKVIKPKFGLSHKYEETSIEDNRFVPIPLKYNNF